MAKPARIRFQMSSSCAAVAAGGFVRALGVGLLPVCGAPGVEQAARASSSTDTKSIRAVRGKVSSSDVSAGMGRDSKDEMGRR
ncbi:MAG: hypothetical protein Kow0073_04570 [Immundisolibacter sp.]